MDEELEKEARMLDLINKVQMFQIATNKVNQNLCGRKLDPVFNLHFTDANQNNSAQDGQASEQS